MIDKRSGQIAYAIMAFGVYHPLPWPLLKYDTNLGGYVVMSRRVSSRTLDRIPPGLNGFGAIPIMSASCTIATASSRPGVHRDPCDVC